MKLAESAVRGTAATLAGQWGRFALQIASTMVLARLLTPADYGLVGMVLVITGLAERLTTMGLTTATIQRKEITHAQVNALFWLNAALGVAAAACLAAAAPLIASFYGRAELVPVVVALSSAFVLSGLTAQHKALLARNMRFAALASAEIAAMGVGAAVAIAAAWTGMGYWALVLFHAVQPLVRLIIVWVQSDWRPSRPARAAEMRQLVSFGAYLSGTEISTYMVRNMDNVLIGRYVGAAELGIYSKAYQLLLMPIRQLQGPTHRVAVATLSRLQDDAERFRHYYRTGLGAMAFTAMPLLAALAVASDDVILLILGDQWAEAGPIFRVLAFAGIAHVVTHTNSWLYIALGRTRRQMTWAFISHPLHILSFVVGLPWGAYGVAVAFTLTTWLMLAPSFTVATRGTPVSLRDIGASVWRPAAITACAYAAGAWASAQVAPLHPFPSAVTSGGVVVLVTALLTLAWPAARQQVSVLLDRVRRAYGRTRDRTDGDVAAGTPDPALPPPPPGIGPAPPGPTTSKEAG